MVQELAQRHAEARFVGRPAGPDRIGRIQAQDRSVRSHRGGRLGVGRRSRTTERSRPRISFARETRMTIVAEGIETAGELDALTELGVRYGQGFHLAEPALLE